METKTNGEVELIAIDGVGKAKLENMVIPVNAIIGSKKQSSKKKRSWYLQRNTASATKWIGG
jgi:hypothetical protein